MAADPNQLLGVLLGTIDQSAQILPRVQQNALQQQLGQQQLALGNQQQQINQQQIAANDQDAVQQAQYQSDVNDWIGKGADGAGLTGLIARYPKQYQALVQGWKVKSANQSQADLRTNGAIFNALDNGSTDVALAEMKARRKAEADAGTDTSELDQHIAEIESGNPAAINAVKGWARANIAAASAAAGDASLAKTVGVDVDSDRYKAIAGQGALDTRTGQFVPNPEGGDPASGSTGGDGSAAGVRRTMGWTPSTADGGDNAPGVVSAKIGTIASKLGVAPGGKLTTAQLPALFDALVPTEGGPGDINYRNNNPGNIKDGKFARSQPGYAGKGAGGYAKFDSLDSGRAAGVQLLKGYYARGQQSVTDIIAGKPVGGDTADAGPSQGALNKRYGKASAGYRWKQDGTLEPIPGGPKDDTGKTGSGLTDDAAGLIADQYLAGDKSALQNIGRGAQGAADLRKVRNLVAQRAKANGMTGQQVAASMVDFAGTTAASRAAGTRFANVELPATEFQKLAPLALKASQAVPRSGFLPFSRAEQSVKNGLNDPRYRQFVAANNSLVNVYARAVSPTGAPHDSDKAHAREMLDTAYDAPSYRAVVQQMQQEIGAARQAPVQVRAELRASVGGGSTPSAPLKTARNAQGQRLGYYPGRGWVTIQ